MGPVASIGRPFPRTRARGSLSRIGRSGRRVLEPRVRRICRLEGSRHLIVLRAGAGQAVLPQAVLRLETEIGETQVTVLRSPLRASGVVGQRDR